MVGPATPYEASGYATFTTPAQETAFLQAVAAQTRAVYSVAGHSVGGLPINRLDIGHPISGTLLVATGQHGNEMPPREAVLSWVRDLAYSTDPVIVDYLASHRVVILSTCNPDRFNLERFNANGVDLNRDHMHLAQPETQAIARTIQATGAHLVVDVHGRHDVNGPTDWEGCTSTLPGTHAAFRGLGSHLYATITGDLQAAGRTWRGYPEAQWLRQMHNMAGYHHALGVLMETWRGTYENRTATMVDALESVRRWHAERAGDLAQARIISQQVAVANEWAYDLPVGHYESQMSVERIDPPPTGYTLTGTIPAAVVEGFGLVVNGTTVDMGQRAGRVIPFLLDPAATSPVASATRIAGTGDPVGPEPTYRPPIWVGAKVCIDGQIWPVTRIRHHVGGETRDVLVPGT